MASIRIVVDTGEHGSDVVKALETHGVEIDIKTLEAGDYVMDHRVAFERVTLDDLLKSYFKEGRLFSRIKNVANSYQRPIMIIEGEDPFFLGRTINPSSIQGFLKKIAVSFRVPAVFTLNEAETAEVISSIAGAEQADEI